MTPEREAELRQAIETAIGAAAEQLHLMKKYEDQRSVEYFGDPLDAFLDSIVVFLDDDELYELACDVMVGRAVEALDGSISVFTIEEICEPFDHTDGAVFEAIHQHREHAAARLRGPRRHCLTRLLDVTVRLEFLDRSE